MIVALVGLSGTEDWQIGARYPKREGAEPLLLPVVQRGEETGAARGGGMVAGEERPQATAGGCANAEVIARRTSTTLAALTYSMRAVSRTPRPSASARRMRSILASGIGGPPRRRLAARARSTRPRKPRFKFHRGAHVVRPDLPLRGQQVCSCYVPAALIASPPMADSHPAPSTSPPWLQPDTRSAMRAAYDGALQAGQGGAAAIAAACAVLLAQVPGLTPCQVGEALGAVVVAAGAAHRGGDAQHPSPANTPPEQRQSGLGETDDADIVAALAYTSCPGR